MRIRRRLISRLIGPVFVIVSAIVLWWSVQWQVSERKRSPAELSKASGNIRLVSLKGASPVMGEAIAAEEAYKWVNVFASWCTPCIAELPHLQALSKESGLPMVGVAWNDHLSKLKPWLKKHGNPFDVIYLDAKGALLGNLQISGLPETLLVDQYNRVLYRHKGPVTQKEVSAMAAMAATLGIE